MDTCFLFVKHLDAQGCVSLKLNANSEIIAPLQARSFAEIREFQQESKTYIVETCTQASIYDLEMPWVADRKARLAIPYALEDKLAQSIDQLHFCFDKSHYQNHHYLVTVVSKERVQYLMNNLEEHNINYDLITLDWFALSPQELCVSENNLLINNDDFKGVLSGELALNYMSKHPLNAAQLFQDSLIIKDLDAPKNEEHSYVWLAKRLLAAKPINLCQGDLHHGQATDWLIKGYQTAGLVAAAWIVSVLLVNAFSLYSLNNQTKAVDSEIASVYKEFFPEAKQVISPKFRIKQLLQTNSSDSQGQFWHLMNQFAKAFKESKVNIEQMRYQNKSLSVTLISDDFAQLEAFENQLKQLQLQVKQTQAATRDKQVVANLELS